MAYIQQYPHFLFIIEPPTATQDERGIWRIKDERTGTTARFMGRCREETNGKGAQITTQGGTAFVFSSLIQIPKGSEPIPEGARVFVSEDIDGERKRIEGICMKYSADQLHNRLWI